jgi:hypothetical protein
VTLSVFTISRQSPKSASAVTRLAFAAVAQVSVPGVPSCRDQASSPSEKAGGIKASPSVITWFMVYPFAARPKGATRRARKATSVCNARAPAERVAGAEGF